MSEGAARALFKKQILQAYHEHLDLQHALDQTAARFVQSEQTEGEIYRLLQQLREAVRAYLDAHKEVKKLVRVREPVKQTPVETLQKYAQTRFKVLPKYEMGTVGSDATMFVTRWRINCDACIVIVDSSHCKTACQAIQDGARKMCELLNVPCN